MVTARIAGLSPGTSPPPVRIPIKPFLVLMRPPCRFLRASKRKIDGSDWMCKRHRSEPAGKFVTIYRKRLTMHELNNCRGRRVACNNALAAFCSPPTGSLGRLGKKRYCAWLNLRQQREERGH